MCAIGCNTPPPYKNVREHSFRFHTKTGSANVTSVSTMKSLSALVHFLVTLHSMSSLNVTNDSLASSEEFSDDESSGSISIEVEDKRLKSMFELVNLQYGFYGLAAELYNRTERLVRDMNGVQKLELLNKKLSELWAKVNSEPVETLGMEAGYVGRVVMNITKQKVNDYCFQKAYLKHTLLYSDVQVDRVGKLFDSFKENVKRLNKYFQPPVRETSHK